MLLRNLFFYTDCFNSEICDIESISELLPRLIIVPGKNLIISKKIDAAQAAFATTWVEPQVITKEVDSDSSGFLTWDDQTNDDVQYNDPNGCTYEELN